MAHVGSFREAFEDFIEDKLYQGARPATIHFYRSNVEHFVRDTGLEHLEELHLQMVRPWLLEHKDLTPNTLATYDRCLRVVCNWLEKRGYVPESPMAQLPRRPPTRTVFGAVPVDVVVAPGAGGAAASFRPPLFQSHVNWRCRTAAHTSGLFVPAVTSIQRLSGGMSRMEAENVRWRSRSTGRCSRRRAAG